MPRFTVDLSDDLDRRLKEIAEGNNITKAEAMRRAFALLSVAEREKKQQGHLGIFKITTDGKKEVISEIVGI